jgi:hypothetical protein
LPEEVRYSIVSNKGMLINETLIADGTSIRQEQTTTNIMPAEEQNSSGFFSKVKNLFKRNNSNTQ